MYNSQVCFMFDQNKKEYKQGLTGLCYSSTMSKFNGLALCFTITSPEIGDIILEGHC